MQVADRWHLMHNLAHALENLLLQKQPALRRAAMPGTEPEDSSDGAFGSGPIMPNRPRNHDRKLEETARRRHERLVWQWKDIRRLYLADANLRHICKTLGVSPRTAYRYKDLDERPPRPIYKRKASVLDPWVSYLVRRWNEGCRNGKKLSREIREEGYAHGASNVGRPVAEPRRNDGLGRRNGERRVAPRRSAPTAPPATWPPYSCAARRSSPPNKGRTSAGCGPSTRRRPRPTISRKNSRAWFGSSAGSG